MSNVIEYEIFDTVTVRFQPFDIFESCVFFNCRFEGKHGKFLSCVFQDHQEFRNPGGCFVNCLFELKEEPDGREYAN